MYNKFNNLGFVIGIFFIIISLILLAGSFFSQRVDTRLNLFTAMAFLIFGLLMGIFSKDESADESS